MTASSSPSCQAERAFPLSHFFLNTSPFWILKPVFRIHDILGWIRIRILGSMLLTNGFGSGSCYFRLWPSRWQQKLIFNTIFSAYYFLKVHLHHFSKIKSKKESQNRRNQGFSYYFCMVIEGFGSGAGAGSGSIPLTSGSGSGRPKNMWIRLRIRIRNTGWNWGKWGLKEYPTFITVHYFTWYVPIPQPVKQAVVPRRLSLNMCPW